MKFPLRVEHGIARLTLAASLAWLPRPPAVAQPAPVTAGAPQPAPVTAGAPQPVLPAGVPQPTPVTAGAPQPAAGAAVPGAPGPAVPAAAAIARGVEWTSLRLLRDKGLLSEAEYTSAKADLDRLTGGRDAGSLVVSRLMVTLYGFVQLDMAYNSTQSCPESCSNTLIQKPGTYRGDHGRIVFSPRDSRLGFRIAAPEEHGIRTSGVLETDFFGPTATTEQGMWTAPVLRIRKAYLKLETSIVDILVGQTWNLFGWQAGYLVTSAQEPGYPGQLTQRSSQLRVSKLIRAGVANLELAAAAMRPPQMDSAMPEWVAAARAVFPGWTGRHADGIEPASIAVSADLRRFRIAEFAATPVASYVKLGGGVAIDGYLPIIGASKGRQDNALSIIGECVVGAGTSDLYTALGAAGTTIPGLPPATPGGPAGTYVANFDPGLAAYDAARDLDLIRWTSYMVGLEFFPAGVGGRLWTFANHGHMQSSNSQRFGGAAVLDPVAGRTRAREDFYDAGLFFDLTHATRIGADLALYDDHYVDGTDARNYSAMATAYLFL